MSEIYNSTMYKSLTKGQQRVRKKQENVMK